MNKNAIIIVLVIFILLLAGVGFYLYQSTKDGSPDESTTESRSLPKLFSSKKSSKAVELPRDFNVASVIPAIVQLHCFNSDFSLAGQGSGTSFYSQGQHWIATNAHVARIDNEFGGCYVYFPQTDGTFYDSAYWAGEVYFYDDKKVVIAGIEVGGTSNEDGGLDYALLKITDNAPAEDGQVFPHYQFRSFPDVFKLLETTCLGEGRSVQIGERVFVIGYPGIGGADITITEGVVSGFEGLFKEWIKTSAKVEQGNSGGLAVLAKDGCALGIPSLSFFGRLESIARILTFQFINTFVEAVEIAP